MTESPRALPPKWASDPIPPPLQAVAQAIADGESWLIAWALQPLTVPYRRLSRECGIDDTRLRAIDRGAPITRGELGALAKAWKVDPSAVFLTLPPGALLPDPSPSPPPPTIDDACADQVTAV